MKKKLLKMLLKLKKKRNLWRKSKQKNLQISLLMRLNNLSL